MHKKGFLFVLGIFLFNALFFIYPKSVSAIGISPPEFNIGTIPTNEKFTGSVNIQRHLGFEPTGDLTIQVVTYGNGATYFYGSPSITIPDGQTAVNYSFSIVPDNKQRGPFEFFIQFLLISTQKPDAAFGVSVTSGATLTIRFDSEYKASASGSSSSSSGSSSGGDTSQSNSTDSNSTTPPTTAKSKSPITQVAPTPTTSPKTSTNTPSLPAAKTSTVSPTKTQSLIVKTPTPISQFVTLIKDIFLPTQPEPSSEKIPSNQTRIDLVGPDAQETNVPQIILTSPTHPTEEQYFSEDIVTLSWAEKGLSAASSYLFTLNQNPNAAPEDLTETTNAPQASFKLEDGEYFYHIATQNENGIGEIFTRRILVDRTPPTNEIVSFSATPDPLFGSNGQLIITASDKTAGIDYYELISPLLTDSTNKNTIPIPKFKFGTYPLTIRVVDKAGNVTEEDYIVRVEPKYSLERLWDKLQTMFAHIQFQL